tara:strand:+ start:741 stop:926 length:186 start_codon:yes stop_codon:yes gene_type:complete
MDVTFIDAVTGKAVKTISFESKSEANKKIQEEKTQSELDDEALLESHLNKKSYIYQEGDDD